jgi:hypothetical protein
MFSGSHQLLTVNSNVNGAKVYFNDSLIGTTPLITSFQRGKLGVLSVRADGYQPTQIALNKEVNPFVIADLLGGYFSTTSTTVDYSNGSMYRYEPSTFMVTLQPGKLDPAQRSAWERRERLRNFVLVNDEAFVSDLATGRGEYIDVVANALAVGPEHRAEAVNRWRNHYRESKTAAQFASMIVAEMN